MTNEERFASLKKRILVALVDRKTYAEALALFEGERGLFSTIARSEEEWNSKLASTYVLEARWPVAAVESVSVRPVPERIVSGRDS